MNTVRPVSITLLGSLYQVRLHFCKINAEMITFGTGYLELILWDVDHFSPIARYISFSLSCRNLTTLIINWCHLVVFVTNMIAPAVEYALAVSWLSVPVTGG